MLNKNRMMVFKNKGKDQEVSELLLLLYEEIILVWWNFLERNVLTIRHPTRYHFPPSPSSLLNSCMRLYLRITSSSSRFLPFPSAPVFFFLFIILFLFASITFLSIFLISHITTLPLHFFLPFLFLTFFSFYSLLSFLLFYVVSFIIYWFVCYFIFIIIFKLPYYNSLIILFY